MGCSKCGGRKNPDDVSPFLTGYAEPPDGADGLYTLAAAPDCTARYTGMFRGAIVYVVGRRTSGERLFTAAQQDEAVSYAKMHKLTFGRFYAKSLCHDTMVALLET